jgi:hypothetical protein
VRHSGGKVADDRFYRHPDGCVLVGPTFPSADSPSLPSGTAPTVRAARMPAD